MDDCQLQTVPGYISCGQQLPEERMIKSKPALEKGAQMMLIGKDADTEGTGEAVPQFQSMKNFRSNYTYAPAP